MNLQGFYRTVAPLVDAERLGRKTVAIVGLGSGGCRVAESLGRLGISLLLVERPGERLEEHNILRHRLGCGSIGKEKLEEMERHLRSLNPWGAITPVALDVVERASQFYELLEARLPDVVAICTDNERSKHAVNAAAVQANIPQVGAGVYDGGVGGEIYRVLPGEACYACITEWLQPLGRVPKRAPANYNDAGAEDSAPIPALNLDIEQIALLQSRMILDLLLAENGPGAPREANVWVFANRGMAGRFSRPFHCEFFQVAPDRHCLVCGESKNADAAAGEILSALETRGGTAGRSIP